MAPVSGACDMGLRRHHAPTARKRDADSKIYAFARYRAFSLLVVNNI